MTIGRNIDARGNHDRSRLRGGDAGNATRYNDQDAAASHGGGGGGTVVEFDSARYDRGADCCPT